MINGHKTIGIFLSGISGTFRRDLCCSLNRAARNHGFNVLFFNFLGTIGADHRDFGSMEHHILDIVPFDKLDGVIFDNNNVFIAKIRKKLHEKLKECKCPVISIAEPCKDFCHVRFDNANAIADFVEHFVRVHGFTRIGYMSGIEGLPDSVERLNAFRNAMRAHGLPEDGVGVFHGDFWYNKSDEAADFFFNKCEQMPQAIICANDYMALSLCDSLAGMGIKVPRDVCVSGYDDIDEAVSHFPSISTATQDKNALSELIFDLFENKRDEIVPGRMITLPTTNVYRVSCGCMPISKDTRARDKNASFHRNVNMLYNLYDTEAGMLEMAGIGDIKQMGAAFEKHSLNFGSYAKFFFFAYGDEEGKCSYEKEFDHPSDKVYPAIWIDMSGTTQHPQGMIPVSALIPPDSDDGFKCYYITHIHFGEHCFGYTAIMMNSESPFGEFYNIWTINIAVAMETLLQRNSIRSLVADLRRESTHDRLTGLLNRKGFEVSIHKGFEEAKKNGGTYVTAVMTDLDKLKSINDFYGHGEGDVAISAIGRFIAECSGEDDISGRTGGDEFYTVMFGKDEAYARDFVEKLRRKTEGFNDTMGKEYALGASCGIYSVKAEELENIEVLLRRADENMYMVKRKKQISRS